MQNKLTVPLCRGHHREIRRCANEAEWWNKAGIGPSLSLPHCDSGRSAIREMQFMPAESVFSDRPHKKM
jgi:hypothetical protein